MNSKLFLITLLFSIFSQLSGCGEPFNPEVNDENCSATRKENGDYSEEYKKKFKTEEDWREFNSKCDVRAFNVKPSPPKGWLP